MLNCGKNSSPLVIVIVGIYGRFVGCVGFMGFSRKLNFRVLIGGDFDLTGYLSKAPMGVKQAIKSLDAFPRAEEHLLQKTQSGALGNCAFFRFACQLVVSHNAV